MTDDRNAENATTDDRSPSADRVYLLPEFCQISLPLQNPGPAAAEWVRRNGNRTYTLHPQTIVNNDLTTTHNWAYGKIARLLLIWISTQVVLQKHQDNPDHIIMLPPSLPSLMRDMGIRHRPNSRDYEQFRNQIRAIANFHMTVRTPHTDPEGHETWERMCAFMMADKAEIGWSRYTPDGITDGSYIQLTAETWERMTHSVPLNAATVEILTQTGKGQDLDVYAWLTQRVYALRRARQISTPLITWSNLQGQMGGNYGLTRSFKARIIPSIRRVCAATPFKVAIQNDGIRVRTSELTVRPVPRPTTADERTAETRHGHEPHPAPTAIRKAPDTGIGIGKHIHTRPAPPDTPADDGETTVGLHNEADWRDWDPTGPSEPWTHREDL